MAPSKFLHDNVAVDKNLTDVDRVIASYLVVRDAFILTLIRVSEKISLGQLISQRSLGGDSRLLLTILFILNNFCRRVHRMCVL